MATPKTPIWPMDNHTEAKHKILRAYLKAWLPIMLQTHDQVLIIDGFAGPGIYEGGQIGSPLIALDVLRTHTHEIVQQKKVRFLFIEKDKRRYNYLKMLLQQQKLPPSLQCDIVCGEFTEIMPQELQILEVNNRFSKGKKDIPVFAFIDPFGYSHTPMHIIARLMRLPKCEFLLTFMYEEINRFIKADYTTKQQQYDDLFGISAWEEMKDAIKLPKEREQFICGLYEKQLQEMAQVKFVRYFRMINHHNVTDYFLFFGTNSLRGLEKMKNAMWAVDPADGYEFSDRTNQHQPQLFAHGPDYDRLKSLIISHFKGKTVTIEEIDYYILAETAFRNSGYKEHVLKPLECANEIKVIPNGKKRKLYSYPEGTTISFQEEKQETFWWAH